MENNGNRGEFPRQYQEGLTKREYFAVMAMNGYTSAGCNGLPGAKELAYLSVSLADALLKELEK